MVNGAAGKIGREVIKAISEASDMTLIGAIARNPNYIGEDAGEVAGCDPIAIPILNDLQATLV